jgi:NADH-quinone oxidoreductase subunit C/D
MSLEPQDTADDGAETAVDYDELARLVDNALLDREMHVHTEAFVIRPDDVQAVLETLKTEAGFDHLSCVTAQEYHDRYESIYHLKQYDDPRRELSVVVPTTKHDPVSESATPVFPTAEWHEREAYDLVGIEYDDHPNLKRILLPDTWLGHPLSLEYDKSQPQIVPLREHANPLEDTHRDDQDTMFLNIGPHHPSTHGVLHVKAVLDGEQIADIEPDIGYIHRCEEQMCQSCTYRHQIMPYPDRWDWSGAGLCNEWAYARTAEALADIDVPEYAQILRTMAAELSRMLAHFLAIGTYALDVNGEFTAAFQYAMREREEIQALLESLTGQRLMFNYFRLGGVAWDLPTPRKEFFESAHTFLNAVPRRLEEYHTLMTNNEIFQMRTVDTGVLNPEEAKAYGCTGPVARGSGIDYDLRRDDPYGYYDELTWSVATADHGDNFSRVLVRLQEVEESARIVEQCLELLEGWPESERNLQANVPRTIKPDADTEVYRAVEAAKGELGIYIRSDGTECPARFKIRGPSFSNLSALPAMASGEYVPDLMATIGSLDTIMGEVDR